MRNYRRRVFVRLEFDWIPQPEHKCDRKRSNASFGSVEPKSKGLAQLVRQLAAKESYVVFVFADKPRTSKDEQIILGWVRRYIPELIPMRFFFINHGTPRSDMAISPKRSDMLIETSDTGFNDWHGVCLSYDQASSVAQALLEGERLTDVQLYGWMQQAMNHGSAKEKNQEASRVRKRQWLEREVFKVLYTTKTE